MKKLLVAALVIGSFAFNASKMGEGLPSKKGTDVFFHSDQERKELVPLLKKMRDDDYAQINQGSNVSIIGDIHAKKENEWLNHIRAKCLQTDWPDETHPVRAFQNIKPWEGKFNPHFHQYGAAFFYVNGSLIELFHLLGFYPNPSSIENFLLNPDYTRRMWLVPRIFSCLCVALTGLVVFLFLEDLCGYWWGIAGLLLIAMSHPLLMECHYLKPYAQSGLFVTLFFYSIQKNWKWSWPILFSVIATSFLPSNLPLVAIMFGLIVARKELEWMAVLAFAFFVFNPWWVLSPVEVFHQFREAEAFLHASYLRDPQHYWFYKFNVVNWGKYWLEILPKDFGRFLTLFSITGFLIGIVYCELSLMCAGLFCAVLTPHMALLYESHYATPIYSLLCIGSIFSIGKCFK